MNKKFALLLALLVSLLMGATSASAAEIKASGDWTVSADWLNNAAFLDKGSKTGETNTFGISQRMRTKFQFIANENLKGVLETQIGTNNWGNGLYQIGAGRSAATNAAPTANTAGNGNIMLRQGYIDFKWPGTAVNFLVGYQSLSLPAAFGGGSAIFDDFVGAAAAVVPVTENISLVGGYARAVDVNAAGATQTTTGKGSAGNYDVAFLTAPMSFMNKGLSLNPFAAYATIGSQSTGLSLPGMMGPNSTLSEGARVYTGGIAATVKLFDPFVVMADFNYGKATYNNAGNTNAASGGRSGFLFDVAVDYTGLSMMTPELFFAYTSGEKGNSTQENRSNRMPVIGNPQNWALGSFWLQGSNSLIADGLGDTTRSNLGFWALGLSLKDIKLVDKLSHTFNVIYFKGTNDVDYLKESGGTVRSATYGQFLTTKDSLWEVDLNTKYQVYDELAMHLQLGYINPSFDKATWRAIDTDYDTYGSKSAYKASLILNYTF